MAEGTDELGAIVPDDRTPDQKRAMATRARQISQDETFAYARRKLVDEYLRRFLSLTPDDPLFEQKCMRAQIACNVVADITTQLAILADFDKLDVDAVAKTIKGSRR
jgi:hypothetical protein